MGVQKVNRSLLTPAKALAGGSASIRFAEAVTALSAAQIENMNATPVTVVAAPPSNQAIVVDRICLQMKPGATQFTGGGVVTVQYHGTSINPHASSVPAATVNSATASENQFPSPSAVIQPPPGVALEITNATTAFATGNGTAVVKIWYHIVTQD